MNLPSTGPTRSTAPFTHGPRGKGVGWSGVYLFNGWFTTQAWQFLIIVSAASSIPGQKNRVLRNCFVLTIPWCVSCANLKICFRNDCGTTIRFPLRITPSKTDNSSFIPLYGFRPCDHFPLWISTSNLDSVTSLLVSNLMSERVTAWRSDIFEL